MSIWTRHRGGLQHSQIDLPINLCNNCTVPKSLLTYQTLVLVLVPMRTYYIVSYPYTSSWDYCTYKYEAIARRQPIVPEKPLDGENLSAAYDLAPNDIDSVCFSCPYFFRSQKGRQPCQ